MGDRGIYCFVYLESGSNGASVALVTETDQYRYVIKYNHLQDVTAEVGSSFIWSDIYTRDMGATLGFVANNHLDFRYFPSTNTYDIAKNGVAIGAEHPGYILCEDYNGGESGFDELDVKALNWNGEEDDPDYLCSQFPDNSKPAPYNTLYYIEFIVTLPPHELDFGKLRISLDDFGGWKRLNDIFYGVDGNPDYLQVDYHGGICCSDQTAGGTVNSDKGHICPFVEILPENFENGEDFRIHFRFYLRTGIQFPPDRYQLNLYHEDYWGNYVAYNLLSLTDANDDLQINQSSFDISKGESQAITISHLDYNETENYLLNNPTGDVYLKAFPDNVFLDQFSSTLINHKYVMTIQIPESLQENCTWIRDNTDPDYVVAFINVSAMDNDHDLLEDEAEFRIYSPIGIPKITNLYSDINANKHNEDEICRAELTFRPVSDVNDYILYWEYNDQRSWDIPEEEILSKAISGIPNKKNTSSIYLGPSWRQTILHLSDIINASWENKVRIDFTNMKNLWHTEYDDPDQLSCGSSPYHEYWIEIEGVTFLPDNTIKLNLLFPKFDGERAEFTFKIASASANVMGEWSETESCEIIDDPSMIHLTYPSAGDLIFGNTTQKIQWLSSDMDSSLLDVNFHNGNDWTTVGSSITNSGQIFWNVPNINADSCRMKIEEAYLGFPYHKTGYFGIQKMPMDTTIAKINFSSPEQAFASSQISSPYVISTFNAADSLVPVLGDSIILQITSNSESGEFSADGENWTSILLAAIIDPYYKTEFYYRDPSDGEYTIQATELSSYGLATISQSVTVSDLSIIEAEECDFSGAEIVNFGECITASGGAAIKPQQPYGMLSYDFFGTEGVYKVYARFLDEANGISHGTIGKYPGDISWGEHSEEFYFDHVTSGPAQWVEKFITEAYLVPDDVIQIRVYPDSLERGWFDYFKLVAVPDTIPPTVETFVTGSRNVELLFSEKMIGADNNLNYALIPDLGEITVEDLGNNRFKLTTAEYQDTNTEYALVLQNMTDLGDNTVASDTVRFYGYSTACTYRLEAEDLPNLQSLVVQDWPECSGGQVVKFAPWLSTGYYAQSNFNFPFETSTFMVSVRYYDEQNGVTSSTIGASGIGTIEGWTWNSSEPDHWATMESDNYVQLTNNIGMNLRLNKNDAENGYVDYIEFTDLLGDSLAPQADVKVPSGCQVDVHFSERVEGMLTVGNYSFSPDLGTISTQDLGNNTVRLVTSSFQVPDFDYNLFVSNISDIANNTVTPNSISFTGYSNLDSSSYKIEAEDFASFQSFEIVDQPGRSGDKVVQFVPWLTDGYNAEASLTFPYPSGNYEVSVAYYDESTGTCNATVSRNNITIEGWDWSSPTDEWLVMTSDNIVNINTGDLIKYRVCKHGTEAGKIDYLVFRATGLNKPIVSDLVPREFKLYHNYPNPFNPGTTITYDVPKDAHVQLNIYNIRGRLVKTIVDEAKTAGHYSVQWNALNFGTGVYFYEMRSDEFRDVKKMLLVK